MQAGIGSRLAAAGLAVGAERRLNLWLPGLLRVAAELARGGWRARTTRRQDSRARPAEQIGDFRALLSL
jgi:hypothetical protein